MSEATKRQRQLPEARRQMLVDATLRCLMREGSGGLSVRKISAEAGISVGLINHHFPSKDDLIAQAYLQVAGKLLAAVKQQVATCEGGPRERLSAFFRGFFSSEVLDEDLFRAWIVFWSQSEHSERVRDAHERSDGAFRAYLEELLKALRAEPETPDFDLRLAAIGLSSMLDGLWIEWYLGRSSFDAEDGLRLCESWIDGLVSGSLGPLRR